MNTSNIVLQKIINETEEIFTNIAVKYPELLSELESGIEKAAGQIKNLGARNENESLDEFLDSSRKKLREKLLKLDSFKGENERLGKDLTESINQYQKSQKYIDEIRDISENLKIVSLNALCNAVKAGKGGEGFSIITESLKGVTENTIGKTRSLEKGNTLVHQSLEAFFSSEEEISKNRKNILNMLEQKVLSEIEVFQKESGIAGKFLSDLAGESEMMHKKIFAIMEELQQQDLMRQTIDQIILSIDDLPDEFKNPDQMPEITAEKLDKAVFSLKIAELAMTMIEEVITNLKKTISVFTENFAAARKQLIHIQEQKERTVNDFVKNTDVFGRISGTIENFCREMTGYIQKRNDRLLLISELIDHVSGIVDEFDSFDKVSGWLQNIAVLSRIELSRSSKLEGMKESVMDMSELVERIQDRIMKGEKEAQEFIKSTSSVYNEYKVHANDETEFLNGFMEFFTGNVKELNIINDSFKNELQTINFFSEDFCELFDNSEKELDILNEIEADLKQERNELAEIKNKLEPGITKALDGLNIEDFKIKDEDMNKIIDKFTIYSHKRIAGEAGGIEVEDSVLDAGEVTLF